MARHLVVLVLFSMGIGVLCATQAPTEARRPARPRAKAAARKPRAAAKPKAKPAKKAMLPGPVDEQSLGFGSTREDVLRLMGKPTRIAKVAKREVWFYGLSTISLAGGKKVIAWSRYDRTLPINVGSAKPDAPPIGLGSTMAELVAALGTPDTVAVQGQYQVWFFGTQSYAVRGGRVVPAQLNTHPTTTTRKTTTTRTHFSGGRQQQQCWCPL